MDFGVSGPRLTQTYLFAWFPVRNGPGMYLTCVGCLQQAETVRYRFIVLRYESSMNLRLCYGSFLARASFDTYAIAFGLFLLQRWDSEPSGKKLLDFYYFFLMLRRHNQIVGKFIEDFRNFIAERYGENRSKVGLEQNALKLSQNRPKSYQKREVKFSGHHLVSLRPLIPLTQFIADPNSPLWK